MLSKKQKHKQVTDYTFGVNCFASAVFTGQFGLPHDHQFPRPILCVCKNDFQRSPHGGSGVLACVDAPMLVNACSGLGGDLLFIMESVCLFCTGYTVLKVPTFSLG